MDERKSQRAASRKISRLNELNDLWISSPANLPGRQLALGVCTGA
jgi:hypothetical protein